MQTPTHAEHADLHVLKKTLEKKSARKNLKEPSTTKKSAYKHILSKNII